MLAYSYSKLDLILVMSRSLTVYSILFSILFYFTFWVFFSFIFLFLEQLGLGVISHAVTSVTS